MQTSETGHKPGQNQGDDKPKDEKEYCFELDGVKYETDEHKVTPEDIRHIAGGVPANVPIVEILEDGTQVTLQEGQEVTLQKCTKLRKLPRFTRGRGRLSVDLEALKREYPEVIGGPNDEYFIIPNFALPGAFAQTAADLLVVIPPTYPTAPPDNFHMTWGLSLKSGQAINNYSGPTNLYGRQWGTFSHHVTTDTWNGGQGDNLLNFIATARARLQEGA